MIDILIIILIVYGIYRLVTKNKKKGGSTTTFTPTSTPTSMPTSRPTPKPAAPKPAAPKPAAPKPAAPKPAAPKAASSSDDPFGSIDTSAFADAFAAMEGKTVPAEPAPAAAPARPAAPASNEAADRKWVRNHEFTEYICDFYAQAWGPEGGIYSKINSGELPIVRLEVTVVSEGMKEKLYLQEGGDFESETTFASFERENSYASLDSAAKRDELLKCITERMATLPTITVKSDGFHVITGVSSAPAPAPAAPAEPPKAAPADPFASEGGFGSVDSAFSGISSDAFAQAFAQMESGTPAPNAEPAPTPAPDPASSDDSSDGDEEMLKAVSVNVLGYYHGMWNKESGTLYTELNGSMPIDHFSFQAKERCLVESVWLIGDSTPLVTETTYAKLCAGDGIADPVLHSASDRKTLELLLAKYLVDELGTVSLKGNDFYPIR